jgi:hypothetical protein
MGGSPVRAFSIPPAPTELDVADEQVEIADGEVVLGRFRLAFSDEATAAAWAVTGDGRPPRPSFASAAVPDWGTSD